jgi:hypothetical protein
MADGYDGSTFVGLDEDAIIGADELPADTFVEHALRSNLEWIKSNIGQISHAETTANAGDYSSTAGDNARPVASNNQSYWLTVPVWLNPGLDRITVVLYYRHANENDASALAAVGANLRAGGYNVGTDSDTTGTQYGTLSLTYTEGSTREVQRATIPIDLPPVERPQFAWLRLWVSAPTPSGTGTGTTASVTPNQPFEAEGGSLFKLNVSTAPDADSPETGVFGDSSIGTYYGIHTVYDDTQGEGMIDRVLPALYASCDLYPIGYLQIRGIEIRERYA